MYALPAIPWDKLPPLTRIPSFQITSAAASAASRSITYLCGKMVIASVSKGIIPDIPQLTSTENIGFLFDYMVGNLPLALFIATKSKSIEFSMTSISPFHSPSSFTH